MISSVLALAFRCVGAPSVGLRDESNLTTPSALSCPPLYTCCNTKYVQLTTVVTYGVTARRGGCVLGGVADFESRGSLCRCSLKRPNAHARCQQRRLRLSTWQRGCENRKSWLSCALHDLGGGYDFVMLTRVVRAQPAVTTGSAPSVL